MGQVRTLSLHLRHLRTKSCNPSTLWCNRINSWLSISSPISVFQIMSDFSSPTTPLSVANCFRTLWISCNAGNSAARSMLSLHLARVSCKRPPQGQADWILATSTTRHQVAPWKHDELGGQFQPSNSNKTYGCVICVVMQDASNFIKFTLKHITVFSPCFHWFKTPLAIQDLCETLTFSSSSSWWGLWTTKDWLKVHISTVSSVKWQLVYVQTVRTPISI